MNPLRPRRPPRRRHISVLTLLLPIAATSPAFASECNPPVFATAGDEPGTLMLREPVDGSTEVRLAGIVIPRAAGRDGPPNTAVGDAARRLVADALQDRCIRLDREADGGDRYGRLLAQVYVDDDVWVQGALLAAGLARVRPTLDERARVADMLAIEREAREGRIGLWRDPAFTVLPAAEPARITDGFQIVEGRVLSAERRQDFWYLNFGAEWRSDFTVTIPKQRVPDFTRAGIEPFALQDRVIRVRGWVQPLNGPMIELVVPEQVEAVDPAAMPTAAGH